MKRHGLYLSPAHRRLFYTTSLIVFLSGAGWAGIHRLDEAARLGEEWRRWKPWLLSTHGLSAVGFVLLLGTLLAGHVPRAWKAEKNRANGVVFMVLTALLVSSGYLLYYLGSESWRSSTATLHLVLGLLSPALLFWHVRSGRRARDPE
jgi:hypothetical protein